MMKRVHALYRVSTKGQVDQQKNDIPMQRSACHQFSDGKDDWKITREFEEKGISGYKVSAKNRDAIQDLQLAAKKKEFEVLLVFMFDRIGRIDDETPFIVEWFAKHGIEVWSVMEGEQRFDNHVDKLTNYIRFWQASGESEKTSMRIKTRMEQLTLEGCYTGGPVPYGYCLVDKGRKNKKGNVIPDIAIEPLEAEVVREIYKKAINEGCGSYRMATYLNDKGLRTHNGSKFKSITINRILRNPRYCGFLRNGKATSDVYTDLSIIDMETFNRAQHILDQRSKIDADKRHISMNTKGKALLSGNVFCAHCGGRMITWRYQDRYTRKDGSEYSVDEMKYLCYHRSRKLCDCDGQAAYKAVQIDEIVISVMRQLFCAMKGAPNKEAVAASMKNNFEKSSAIRHKLSAELEKQTEQLERLRLEIAKTLTGESCYAAEDLQAAIAEVKRKKLDCEERLAGFEAESKQQKKALSTMQAEYVRFKSWAEEFDSASLEQKKMIACQLFSRIELERGYNVHFTLNMSYRQFSEEWANILSNEQLKIAQ